jgi:DNA-binding transcriptional ArsR family regulator
MPAGEEPEERVLRAIAHPKRFLLLQHLATAGPTTATAAARLTGLTPSACSWHLRYLARQGLLKEEPSPDRRERLWRYVGPSAIHLPSTHPAHDAATLAVLTSDRAIVQDFLRHRRELPPAWQEAATFLSAGLYLTPDELKELTEELRRRIAPYQRDDPGSRPPGAARVVLGFYAVPWFEPERAGDEERDRG